MKSVLLLSALVLTTAWAETWSVRGKGTEFVLKATDNMLNYEAQGVHANIPLRDCSREVTGSFMQSLRGKLRQPASYSKTEGLDLVIDGNATPKINAYSALGMTFASMNDSILRLKLLAGLACESAQ